MEIHGKLVPSNAATTLPVALVNTGAKQVGVAVIVAEWPSGLTDNPGYANAAIELLGTTANSNGMFGDLNKIEIAAADTAAARVEMVMAAAKDGDIALFMCADSAAFDATWKTLNVQA